MFAVELEVFGVIEQHAGDCDHQCKRCRADTHVAMPHVEGTQLEALFSTVVA